MAAVIRLHDADRNTPARLAPVRRPALVLIEGGAGRPASPRPDPSVGSARGGAPGLRTVGRVTPQILRQRLAAAGMALAAVVGCWSLLSGPSTTISADAPPVHMVAPGETLWGVASSLGVSGDLRDVVDRLAQENGGYSVSIGQRVRIPADLRR